MVRSHLKAFRDDRSGAVIIYVALAMPVLVGGMGLGAETGYRYYNQRLLQHAADFSAYAGAVHKYRGEDKPAIDAAALKIALEGDFDNTAGVGNIAVNIPPLYGAFQGDPTAVEVILTETRPRLLSAVFGQEDVVIPARAVAAVTGEAQPACILALNETESAALQITGSTNVSLNGCAVAANSTADDAFDMSGLGSYLTTDCVSTSGGADTTANLTLTDCPEVKIDQAPVRDPYYWVMEPAADAIPCQTTYTPNGRVGKPSQTTDVAPTTQWTHPDGTVMSVMRFCDGLSANGIVNFAPGLYIIENGEFTAGGTSTPMLTGEGVTFYFTNGGAARLNGTATLDLSAPETGPYSGLLFFGDRDDPESHIIQGNATSTLKGAIYATASEVTFTGNSDASSGCTQVIADTITLTGDSDLAIDCAAEFGEQILLSQLISIVE